MAILTGTKSKDTLRGGAAADTIFGADGKDKLYGGEAADRILGGEGADLLEGEAGDDWLDGGDDDDTIVGGAGADFIIGYDGDDEIDGGEGDDSIDAGEGDDQVQGGEGADTVQAGDGKDEVDGGAGADQLFGADGKDDLDGGEGDDVVDGGGGNDRLTGGLGDDLVQGGAGNDTIVLGEGFDTLLGGTGSDSFDLRVLPTFAGVGDFKTQTIDGGEGGDTVAFSLARSAVTLTTDASGVTRVFFGGATLAEISRVEKISFGSGGTVTLPPPPNTPPQQPLNAVPQAGADAATTGEDASVVVQTRANDSDADGHALTVTGLGTAGTLGQVSILNGAAGTIAYNPGAAFNGLRAGQQASDVFTYTVSDGHGGQATASVTVTVTGANDGPLLVSPLADAVAAAGQALNLTLPAGAFADPDIGDTLTLSAKLADGSDLPAWLTFTPASRTFSGAPAGAEVLNIRVTATDAAGASVSDDFSLRVQTSGGPPVAGPDVVIAALTGQIVQLRLDAPSDPDGDAMSATIDALPDFGVFRIGSAAGAAVSVGQTLTIQELQSLVFVAPGEGHDEQALLYIIGDGHGGQDQGAVTISVHPQAGILVDVRNTLVFSGVDPSLGRELFTLDASGHAVRLDDINPGAANADPGELTLLDGVLYFAATKGGVGRELFQLTPSSAVELVANISALAGSSFPHDLYAFGGDLHFSGNPSGVPAYMRLHEGLVEQATGLVRDVSEFIEFDGDLYFTGREAIVGGGFWLYKLDGATGDIGKVPGAPSALAGDSERFVYNGELYFIGFNSQTGRELWKVDASGQASIVADLYAGPGASDPHDFTILNGALHFLAMSNTAGLEVFRLSNGTPQVVAETWAGAANGSPIELIAFGGRLFFTGSASTAHDGRELLQIADPTGASPTVTLFRDFNTNSFPYYSSAPHNLAVVGGALYLTANASPNNVPLWQSWRVNADFSLTHLTALDGHEVDFTKAMLTQFGIFLGDPAGFLDPVTGGFVALAGVSDVDEITPFTFFDYAPLSLAGGAGRDTLIGTDLADNLTGNGGDDAIQGGKGADTLSGGEGADNIGGGDEADIIYGGAGADVIDAGAGDDLIAPGAGDDFVNGGAGSDTVSYADALAGVTIDLSKLGTVQNTGGSGADQLVGVEFVEASPFGDHIVGTGLADVIRGLGGADRLEGGDGDDVLEGGEGADILIGGKGNDTLTGGAGADSFVFLNQAWGPDTITDFEIGVDKIVYITTGFVGIAPGAAALLVNGVGGPGGLGEPWPDIYFFPNGWGAGGEQHIAILPTAPALSVPDFSYLGLI